MMADQRNEADRSTPRLVAVAVLGFILFFSPLVLVFDRRAQLFGVPVLAAYLFLAWVLIIGLVAAITTQSGRASTGSSRAGTGSGRAPE
jgi:hypothetical protein